MLPTIVEILIRSTGKTSLAEISAELNKLRIPTARRRQWHAKTVRNLLKRAGRLLR